MKNEGAQPPGCGEKDVNGRKSLEPLMGRIYVTKPMRLPSLIPWVTHGSELAMSIFNDVNSLKVNVSNLLYMYMGMIYILSLMRVKPCPIGFKEKYVNPPHVWAHTKQI